MCAFFTGEIAHGTTDRPFSGSENKLEQANVSQFTMIEPLNSSNDTRIHFEKSSIAVASNCEGRLQIFVVNGGNSLLRKWQIGIGAGASWIECDHSLSDKVKVNSNPVVIYNIERRPEVFVIGVDNALYHRSQVTAGSTTNWTPYHLLGGSIKPGSSPAVIMNSDGRLEVFVIGADNALYHKSQVTAGSTTNWTPYHLLGGSIKPGSSPAVGRNSDGRLEVFVIGADNALYLRSQVTAGSTTNWTPYHLLGDLQMAPASSPAVIMNSDGRLEVFVIGADNSVNHITQTSQSNSSSWTDLERLGSLERIDRELPTLTDPSLAIERFVGGLSFPTSMAFMDSGDILVLEKSGSVRLISGGQLKTEPVLQIPSVNSERERGLLGIANSGNSVYLFYTESIGSELRNRIYKYAWADQKLVNPVLLVDLPGTPGPIHNGGKLLIGPDGYLYAVIGDVNRNGTLQNLPDGEDTDDTSVIFRIDPTDGSPATGNPFSSDPNNPLSKYYAYGIRNSFGLTFDPVNGKIWDTENGPDVFDEINLVNPGFNSGWKQFMGPLALGIVNETILVNLSASYYAHPIFNWRQPIGITDLEFLPSVQLGPYYSNNLFVGDFKNGNLYFLKLNGARNGFVFSNPGLSDSVVDNSQELSAITLGTGFTGITDIETGQDGLLYILSAGNESSNSGSIFRVGV